MKKKTIRRTVLAAVAVAVIVAIISYNYNIDQTNIRGKAFGDALKAIQEDLTYEQNDFDAKLASATDGGMNMEEFASASKIHFAAMQEIIDRYALLNPPAPYESSVDLFRLSTQSQLDRDRQEVLFVQTGDPVHEARAGQLHQESFEYELAALADYKAAQIGQAP